MAMTPWKGDEETEIVFKGLDKRIHAAAIWFRDQLRKACSVPNPDGKHPSAEYEYPRKVTGWHRKNIQCAYDKSKKEARIGTNVPYGRWLETGTSKMAPRPWLSNGIRDFMAGVKAIVSRQSNE